MKQYLLSFLFMMVALCAFQTVCAKESDDDESRHVIVTLKSGERERFLDS